MKDIKSTHEALAKKNISCVELTDEHLKIAKKNESNSLISILEDSAKAQAIKIDDEISKSGVNGYLHGIPYTLKDLFITKGIRTTAGSKSLYNYVPTYDGHVHSCLEKSGGVLIGKNGCDEFGMGSTNQNTIFGEVKFPLNKDYVPGGSSGGSAVSVLEQSCVYSIGTDTGGSVRLPANFCGLVGFKPSYGRISRYGQIAYGSSLDQASPFARTPLDMAMIVDQLSANDPRDMTQVDCGSLNATKELLASSGKFDGLKLGYSEELLNGCRDDVKENLESALKEFEKLGAKLVKVDLPHLKYCVAVYYLVATSEASSNLSRFDGIHYGHRTKQESDLIETYKASRAEGFGPEVKRRVMLGTFALSSGYSDAFFKKAAKVRRLIFNDFQNAYEKCDLIFSPTCATTAFKSGEKFSPLQMYMNDLYTIPVNLAGLPAISLPYGVSKLNSLPTGFQLIGAPFSDKTLLVNAHKFTSLKGAQ